MFFWRNVCSILRKCWVKVVILRWKCEIWKIWVKIEHNIFNFDYYSKILKKFCIPPITRNYSKIEEG